MTLEQISAELPSQRNLSSGYGDFGTVVTPNIVLATVQFRETSNRIGIAAVFYTTTISAAVKNGTTTVSGVRLREERLDVVPPEKLDQKIADDTQDGRKAFQGSVTIPSTILDVAMSTSLRDKRNISTQESSSLNRVVMLLYENTAFFTDRSIQAEDLYLASPVLAVSVGTEHLENLPQNVSVRFSTAHLEKVTA